MGMIHNGALGDRVGDVSEAFDVAWKTDVLIVLQFSPFACCGSKHASW